MSSLKNELNLSVLKEIWQDYLRTSHEKEKEEKLKLFLEELTRGRELYEETLFCADSELSSLSNLLGHELLKVVNHQCDILEDDLAFVNFLQQGTGLYLLQSLYVLAEQVDNCNTEVSNVLISVLDCLLSASCDLKNDDALGLLQMLTTLYKELTTGKKTFPDLYRTIQLLFTQSNGGTICLLSLLALLLDIIWKLNGRGCSLSVTESTVSISEKLVSLMHLFTKENNSEISSSDEDLPRCTWSANVEVVCVCMVMCPLWTFLAAKNSYDVFTHRVDLSEQVETLMMTLKNLRTALCWSGSGFREHDVEFLAYKLFVKYSLLGFVLVVLNSCIRSETESCSGIDLTRKLYSKNHLKTFVSYGGCEFIVNVVVSLNEILSSAGSLTSELENLLKTQAKFVMNAIGHLVTSLKRAMSSLQKSEGEMLAFSLDRVSTPKSHAQPRQRFSHVTSTSSLPQTPGSSSEEDWEQQITCSVGQCHNHSSKDCAVSRFCFAVMSAYKESTVEDIDLVCLNSLARSGTCQCMNVSSFAVTLLSRWVH